MPITLTIKDRHELNKYTHKLPSTVALRNSVDVFFDQIQLTPEEKEKYEIKINKETYELSCNDESYTVVYEEFPPEVMKAISNFVKSYDGEEGQKSQLVLKALAVFKKLVPSLS